MQVRPEFLPDFLNDLRSKGYTVIAAEQTTDSQRMDGFQFPKKVRRVTVLSDFITIVLREAVTVVSNCSLSVGARLNVALL